MSDNASNNDTAMKALGEQLISVDPGTGKQDQWYGGCSMQIRYVSVFFKKLFLIYIYFSCVAHIIHLATKKCLNTIYPEGNKQEVTMMRARSHGKLVIYLAKSWCLSNRYV